MHGTSVHTQTGRCDNTLHGTAKLTGHPLRQTIKDLLTVINRTNAFISQQLLFYVDNNTFEIIN